MEPITLVMIIKSVAVGIGGGIGAAFGIKQEKLWFSSRPLTVLAVGAMAAFGTFCMKVLGIF